MTMIMWWAQLFNKKVVDLELINIFFKKAFFIIIVFFFSFTNDTRQLKDGCCLRLGI